VLSPGVEERSVYIPESDWWDLWTGEPAPKGWITAPAPTDTIPVYIRGGAGIPLWMSDTIALGTGVGLPALGSGRLVLMVFPGSARRTLVDPITLLPWTATIALDESGLTIDTDDAPTGTFAWIRGSAIPDDPRDHHVQLPIGDSVTTIDLDSHER
jgi:hypothetical protein